MTWLPQPSKSARAVYHSEQISSERLHGSGEGHYKSQPKTLL